MEVGVAGSGEGGGRRRRSLSDENIDNPNLRDFLRVKQEDDENLAASSGTPGVGPPAQPLHQRTLLDIIRDDPYSNQQSKKTWKVFRDKLRLKRAGAGWTSSVHTPASDIPIPSTNRMMQRRQSTRFPTTTVEPEPNSEPSIRPESAQTAPGPEISRSGLSSMPSNRALMMRHNSGRIPSLSATREAEMSQTFNTARSIVQMADQNIINAEQQQQQEEENEGDERDSEEGDDRDSEEGEEGEPQVRMSLMALLAETDRQMGIDGSPFIMEDDDEEEVEEEVTSGIGEYNCCVCMVRIKGAAFIPCGHTFCRLCSRELWVQRGSCPLCNNFILEILDIF